MSGTDPNATTLDIKILSLPIEITTNYRPFLKEFCDLTSAWALPGNGESPAVRFRVMHKREYTHIEKDSRTVHRLGKDYQLCPVLMDELRESCYERIRDYLLFHAGAVAKEGKTLLLPGKSGSGKTTLTLGLMNHGYGYLTDEVGAVHLKTRQVVPFQRPIYFWTWSRPLRQEVSRHFRVHRYRDNDNKEWRWQYIVPQAMSAAPRDGRWNVDFIIFPRYTPAGKTVLRPLGTAQALVALMRNSWNARLLPDGGLSVCKGLVRGASCYTLEMGDLDTACKLIEDLQVKAH